MCFDYTNELADVSAGDYFHPEMETGAPGVTALIIRSDPGRKLVEGAKLCCRKAKRRLKPLRPEPMKPEASCGRLEQHPGGNTPLKRRYV